MSMLMQGLVMELKSKVHLGSTPQPNVLIWHNSLCLSVSALVDVTSPSGVLSRTIIKKSLLQRTLPKVLAQLHIAKFDGSLKE
ncbi:hypothetical protein SUGI_0401290 [Cryptomeria japonica]|nr:hypothetical protein SUGI_0401290 [Cryptomeria japonica]